MPTSLDWQRAFARAPADVQVMVLDTTTTDEEMPPDLELLIDGVRIGAHSGDGGERIWVLPVRADGDADRQAMVRIRAREPDYSDGMITHELRPIDDIVRDVIATAREMAAARKRA